jgi:hypothetical protein
VRVHKEPRNTIMCITEGTEAKIEAYMAVVRLYCCSSRIRTIARERGERREGRGMRKVGHMLGRTQFSPAPRL